MFQARLQCGTRGRGLVEISRDVQGVVRQSGVQTGLCSVFIRHTSASLLITENADPDVQVDLETAFARLAPDGDAANVHTCEGPDDMPAHTRSALTQTALTVPVDGGELLLGTWQGIFVWEHRHRAHRREIVVTVSG
ncbi:MAG: secondary thiamine-phosphate synthase enzyme YjbQ [Pseudomonadota bacterium]